MTTAELVQTVLAFALGAPFIVMGVTHFVPGSARTMAAMIPPALRRSGIPNPQILVAFTGICEIAGGLGLLLPPFRVAAVIALVLFLIAVFPANVHAAAHPDRFGRLAIPFWPRFVGQLVLIALLLALLL
ncbi:putative membrane protein [Glaciihabitans tibetensis]|uniref:Putative membrane protein n=1 Tax=Glaciihabitans tibetensis TaxID=1266600 RepID=A0A2T0VFW3_9MICO|nr:DoxX family membrane protein [Glaciihabitans tibetensis]PRY69107.1 putative membrane protein [Glaciihabitans tibetensis]